PNEFTLAIPRTIAQTTVNGEQNYWVRARIINGDYGVAAFSKRIPNSNPPAYELVDATFKPPSLASLKLSYQYTAAPIAASAIRVYDRLTLTDLFAIDRTTKLIQERKSGEKTLKLESVEGWIVGDRVRITDRNPEAHKITQVDPTTKIVTLDSPLTQPHVLHTPVIRDFQPFLPVEDTQPTLYLGFDRPLPNRTIALYFQVDPPTPGEITSNPRPATPVQLVWEYTTPTGWSRLDVQDETELFSDRGLIRLIAPNDFAARREFGQSLYWLRCRWETGSFRVPPRLRRLLTNTMWASQTTTRTDEILGSSTGNPNQSFRPIEAPVLEGQTLEVIEESETVQWQEVTDFYGSSASDRHYTLDRLTGTIRFGDGQRGRIPPAGSNNLRLHYRTGGGTQGNQAVETITQLKTTIPSIDRVTNLERAGGGAESEAIDRVKARGAKFLRHRDRAVTAEDLEDLALVASPAVARAKAITPRFDPITLQWFPSYPIRLDQAGEIQASIAVDASRAANLDLEIKLYGPAQSNAYAQQIIRSNRDSLTFTVPPELFELGNAWRITVVNRNDNNLQGTLAITTPNGSQNHGLEAPASSANREITDAGKVELMIVPQSTAAQPTPSLMLINQVEQYLRDRASPTLDLQVTEPDWVEVTVRAAVVPVSLDVADAARTAATAALTRFLHPLTGGSSGQGWSFGRRPFPSDLYAVLESIPEVDHVTSLSIVSIPSLGDDPTITPLPADRFDRFLIYSGNHQIILP
nr:baseplate J/gp47 family protein [Leptolyngbya sp. Prado105]